MMTIVVVLLLAFSFGCWVVAVDVVADVVDIVVSHSLCCVVCIGWVIREVKKAFCSRAC